MTGVLALPLSYAPQIVRAIEGAPRISLIWLRDLARGGDSQAFLQPASPPMGELHAALHDQKCLDCHGSVVDLPSSMATSSETD